MAEQWPAQLQDKLNEADFAENPVPTVIKSDTEIGIPKTRRRYTKGYDIITCSIFIEKSDVALFKSFFNTTLNAGVTTFEYTDPFTDTLQEFRFDVENPYRISPVGGNTLNLQMNWERVP